MVYFNNVLAALILVPVTLFNGEAMDFYRREDLHNPYYFVTNVFAGFVGFFLNFASLSCVAATGPTTYAIVGSVNKIPTSVIGWALFDAEISKEVRTGAARGDSFLSPCRRGGESARLLTPRCRGVAFSSLQAFFFICVSMTGGFIYSYSKIKEARDKQQGK